MARMLRKLGERNFQMLVGAGIGFLFGASLVPQTILLKKYRGVLASYKDGEEEPVAEDLLELKDKVSQHRDIIWKRSWQNTYILLVSRKTMFLCVISREKMADFIFFMMLVVEKCFAYFYMIRCQILLMLYIHYHIEF